MGATSRVLLLDDGELDDVASLLDALDLEYTRLRGGELLSDTPPPLDLLVATPRRASSVNSGSPDGAKPGRPTRIIVTEQDSNAMRQMLRRAGYHLLVRRPTHPEIWRLLIQRAIFQGDERRRDTRLAVGSDVQVDASGEDQLALLVDISSRGCRVNSSESLPEGSLVTLSIPASPADGMSIELQGEVIRCAASSGIGKGFDAALTFIPLAAKTQERLTQLLRAVASGPDSLATTTTGVAALPSESANSTASTASKSKTEAEPSQDSITANLEICLKVERRQQARRVYEQSVLVESSGPTRVLMGRDLSIGGMRVERLPDLHEDDRFTLAIYAPARAEPLQIDAVVCRDDGEEGLALRFERVSEETARELEKLVAALPDVESLDRSESESMGTVLGEIVEPA